MQTHRRIPSTPFPAPIPPPPSLPRPRRRRTPHRTARPPKGGGRAMLPSSSRILHLLDTQPASTPSRGRDRGGEEWRGAFLCCLRPWCSVPLRVDAASIPPPPFPPLLLILHSIPALEKQVCFVLPRGGRDVDIRREMSTMHAPLGIIQQPFCFSSCRPGCVCLCECVCVAHVRICVRVFVPSATPDRGGVSSSIILQFQKRQKPSSIHKTIALPRQVKVNPSPASNISKSTPPVHVTALPISHCTLGTRSNPSTRGNLIQYVREPFQTHNLASSLPPS
ncbi:hypothetical protein LX36DRAFT_416609 [Colletotrichum falcatum]|nr:hypothetical protein LX36DRAFT_416609 [Colletotrichum falcatum]